jgi:hypothetical protein
VSCVALPAPPGGRLAKFEAFSRVSLANATHRAVIQLLWFRTHPRAQCGGELVTVEEAHRPWRARVAMRPSRPRQDLPNRRVNRILTAFNRASKARPAD